MQNYEKYPEPRLIVVSHTFVYVTNRFQRSTGCQRRPEKKRGVTHVSPLTLYIPKLLNYSLLPNLKNKLQRLFNFDNAAKLHIILLNTFI